MTLADLLRALQRSEPTLLDGPVDAGAHGALPVAGITWDSRQAAPGAVFGAVLDALRPFGVDRLPMPCDPESIWRAINHP